jgi:hypothetical protein
MKSHSKRFRLFRRFAIAGCIAALAVPASASAMFSDGGPYVQRSEAAPYSLPANFRTEVQTSQPKVHDVRTYALPANFKPEVSTPVLAKSSPNPTIVRQIETVPQNDSRTLAIVLASVALAIALGTLGFALIQRREVGNPTH